MTTDLSDVRRCENCAHAGAAIAYGDRLCRRRPPVIVGDKFVQPLVQVMDYCGEWAPFDPELKVADRHKRIEDKLEPAAIALVDAWSEQRKKDRQKAIDKEADILHVRSKAAVVPVVDDNPKKEPVLCYVEGPWAYFTTKDLKDQHGEDWNLRPFQNNAGPPYEPCWHNTFKARYQQEERCGVKKGQVCQCEICVKDWSSSGTPLWRISRIAWEGPLKCVSVDRDLSVKEINAGCIPWLTGDGVEIKPGVTKNEFIALVRKAGGAVYKKEQS